MKKIIIILSIVIPVVVAGFILLKKEKPLTFKWETIPVEKGDMNKVVTATGTLEPVTEVQVGTQVSGEISDLYVDFNSQVKKGQIIAMIDTTNLAAQVFDTKANYHRKNILLDQAEREYNRITKLFKAKVVAQVEMDKALDDFQTAESNLLSAETQLNRAKINLDYATIRSPIDGIVISKNVEQGQTVAASFNSPTLFNLVNDLTKMQVEASIDEADIGQIEVDQKVDFSVDAYSDETFNGVVRQVRLKPVIVSNVVTYTVIIDVPNPDMKLMPGMTATITVMIDSRNDILKVPSRVLSFTPPSDYLTYYYESLPDSMKQGIIEMRERVVERMKSMGLSDKEIENRLERFSQTAMFRQGSGGRPAGGSNMGAGMGGGSGMGMQNMSRQQGSTNRGNFGRIWIRENEVIRPLMVSTGLSEGGFVEIRSPRLQEGMEVIIGVEYDEEKVKNQNQRSPFMPTGGGGMRRGLR
ncbi:MAG: efflux RND transporter periplasmic adaptor subunit [Bacteroidetes bacterium]|nr:efflux RND transporter periplasmic adaptor subunit [Bacteroidota bacterium]